MASFASSHGESKYKRACRNRSGNGNGREQELRLSYKACEDELKREFGGCRGEEHVGADGRIKCIENGHEIGWRYCDTPWNDKLYTEEEKYLAAAKFGECLGKREKYEETCLKVKDPSGHGKHYLTRHGNTCIKSMRRRGRKPRTETRDKDIERITKSIRAKGLRRRKNRRKRRTRRRRKV